MVTTVNLWMGDWKKKDQVGMYCKKKKKKVTVFDSVETKRNSSDEYFSNKEDILNSHYFTSLYN